jgi:hypothetical protein
MMELEYETGVGLSVRVVLEGIVLLDGVLERLRRGNQCPGTKYLGVD